VIRWHYKIMYLQIRVNIQSKGEGTISQTCTVEARDWDKTMCS
jgi:hypothetical protein